LVCEVVARVGSRPGGPQLVRLLTEAVRHLGVDAGYYASVVVDGETVISHRLLLACDPTFGLALERFMAARDDPWLRQAMATSEPFCASHNLLRQHGGSEMERLAAEHGFRSALVIPVPAGGGMPRRRVVRLGVMVLGSRSEGCFEHEPSPRLRVVARALAMELHESYGDFLSRERIRTDAISSSDLDLLRRDRAGESTKVIARVLNTTPHAIDQRFYRLGMKLGARSRHAAVRLAVEYGLI
ncbi:MAG: autoinducer binding domain-containing protein, partial [Caldimonas sp.]